MLLGGSCCMITEAMYFGPARSTVDFKAARLLAANILEVHSQTDEALEYKSFLWNDPLLPGIDHVIIAADQSGEIHGVVRLVPRSLRHATEVIKIAGISSVCVVESQRNRGLARHLLNTALKQAESLGYELTVLFARRAVDHLYPRFDIWGLASYSKLTIETLPSTEGQPSVLFRELQESDLQLAASWHKDAYCECFGWLERSIEQWRFLLQWARRRRFSLSITEIGGTAVGYVVTNGRRVTEIGFAEPGVGLAILSHLSRDAAPLLIDMPPRHKLHSQLAGADCTISSRRCEYGGHMVGVLNRTKACARLAARVSQRALMLGLQPYQERIDGLILDWDGRQASVRIDSQAICQPLGLYTTARLVGAVLPGVAESSLLAPTENLNFLSLDEF